jgi:hypothetical protein
VVPVLGSQPGEGGVINERSQGKRVATATARQGGEAKHVHCASEASAFPGEQLLPSPGRGTTWRGDRGEWPAVGREVTEGCQDRE